MCVRVRVCAGVFVRCVAPLLVLLASASAPSHLEIQPHVEALESPRGVQRIPAGHSPWPVRVWGEGFGVEGLPAALLVWGFGVRV